MTPHTECQGCTELERLRADLLDTLEGIARRLDALADGHPAGRPWEHEYLIKEVRRTAETIRAALTTEED